MYNTTANQVEVYDGRQWTTFYRAFELKVEYKSADFSITKNQRETLFVVNEAAEVTLPSLSSVNDGFRVYVKRTAGLGLVSVLAATGDIIEGILSVDIGTQGGSLEIVATASEWVLLNGAL